VQSQVTAIGFMATGSGSPSVNLGSTNLGAERVCQLEAPGFELGRTGRSFVGGHTAIAAAISPVADLPTTIGPMVLYNSAPAAGQSKVLVVRRLSFSYSTAGTLSAFGSNLFAGVTPSRLATALVANGTNIKTQATRGTGTPSGFVDAAKTIVQPVWMTLGGIAHGAETTMSIGYTVSLDGHPFVVPPGFALAFGVLSAIDTAGATTPLYILSVAWDEIEAVLP
jgi:hypothetical protein